MNKYDADCAFDEDYNPDQQPRSEQDLRVAIERLIDQVWYTRCFNSMRAKRETIPPAGVEAALRIEAEFKARRELIEPSSDFEWGMINGKLSALRWALGDEWDFLDT
jgi:hypothetical protein